MRARPHDVAGAPHPNLPGCEDTRCVCRTSPGSLPSFQQGCRGGLGLLGRTRKPWGRARLSVPRVLVGPGMMRAPTAVTRLKTRQRARQHAPHDNQSTNQSTMRQSDNQTIRHSDTQTLRHSDNQTIRRSDDQTIRRSDYQPIRRSDDQTIRRSDDQTIK